MLDNGTLMWLVPRTPDSNFTDRFLPIFSTSGPEEREIPNVL